MRKALVALAVLSAGSLAHAQSNMTIYGTVDAGYVKSTGTKAAMGEKYNNRLGFMGTEDLGNGLKATFQLEQRFNLFDGSSANSKTFEGASNVGLKGRFGQVRFGRVDELSTETFRKIDPFEQYGVGSMFKTHLRGDNLEGRISNTVRYDSPNLNGFQLGASYTLKKGSKSYFSSWLEGMGVPEDVTVFTGNETAANDGYAISATYANGPLYLVSNYNVAVNTNKSYNWNVGGAYTIGASRISAGYEQTRAKDTALFEGAKWGTWLVGVSHKIGAGTVNASYSQRKNSQDSSTNQSRDKKIALGYNHSLSKRTSVYVEASRTKYDSNAGIVTDYIGNFPRALEMAMLGRDQITAIAIGMTHKF
ncbi:MAG: Outer rane porin protein 32 [Burkholderiaceae bacterium]|nr:Outer rane porin protein 32 [Burkholderiaceae bacterium]